MRDYTDEDYYWEKAEFQDPVSHRMHVDYYKMGIHSSIAFDEEYMKEAQAELEAANDTETDNKLQGS